MWQLLFRSPGAEGSGWDKWVAIGTLLLAVVTTLAVFVPLFIERSRRRGEKQKERALRSALAQALHDQVVMTAHDLKLASLAMQEARGMAIEGAARVVGTVRPNRFFLLDRFLDKLWVFGDEGPKLTEFAAGVLNLPKELESIVDNRPTTRHGNEYFWLKYDSVQKQMSELAALGFKCAEVLESNGASKWPRPSASPNAAETVKKAGRKDD